MLAYHSVVYSSSVGGPPFTRGHHRQFITGILPNRELISLAEIQRS